MLQGISKILTGDMLKVLCDMGHGDEIIIADANFPGEGLAKRLIRCPGVSSSELLNEIADIFPLDFAYTKYPAAVLDLTPSDVESGMPTPETWKEYTKILSERYENFELGKIERFNFYNRTKSAYAVIMTGEERVYGDLLLTKGVVK